MKIKRSALVARLKSAWDAAIAAKKTAEEIARLKHAYADALADSLGKEDEEIDDPDHKAAGGGDGTVTGAELEALIERCVSKSLSTQLPENLKNVLTADDVKKIVKEVIPAAALEGKKGIEIDVVLELVGNVLTKAISNATHAKSKMQFGDDVNGSIEMPVSWRKGNLPIHGKQLLNILMRREMNEGIDAKALQKAIALGDRMFDNYRVQGAKALTSTAAGTGDEWVPTDLSAVLLRRLYLESILAQLMASREIEMPSQPYELPLSTTRPTFYLNSTENTDGTASDIGTAKPVLSAAKLMALVEYSYEVEEDSIIPILATVQMLLGEAAAYALESAIINGDTTATHMDSDIAAIANAAEKSWKGFRKLALTNSATKLDMSTGGISRANLVALKKKGGKYMRKMRECAWVVSPNNENDLLNLDEVALWQNSGVTPTLATGEIKGYLGAPIVVSEAARDTLNASGVYDGITTTKGAITLANLSRFIMGNRRGFTVEVDKSITAQKKQIVASFRKAFTPIETPSSTVPSVVTGYNFTS